MDALQLFLLFLLGVGVGAYGTLIGAGGGFIMVPLLLIFYPHLLPPSVTGISLSIVFFNALSGSFAYARMRRVDYRTGILFALTTVPGAIIGAIVTDYIQRGIFQVIFGIILILLSLFIIFRPAAEDRPLEEQQGDVHRVLTDAEGKTYAWRYNRALGLGISFVVGFLSSILGIGGGIIHVPAMNYMLNFPTHLATATSHFILAISAFTGAATHLLHGDLSDVYLLIIPLAIGVIIGAQIGARLSRRLHGRLIIQLLGGALGLVGIRLILGSLGVNF